MVSVQCINLPVQGVPYLMSITMSSSTWGGGNRTFYLTYSSGIPEMNTAYPRPYMQINSALATKFTLAAGQASGAVRIVYTNSSLCLDGWTGVTQYNSNYPTPYLDQCLSSSGTQDWFLTQFPIPTNVTYRLYSYTNSTVLDGNADTYIPEFNRSYPNPFLWTRNSAGPNQMWNFVGNECLVAGVCPKHSICVDTYSSYYCDCFVGYNGTNCDTCQPGYTPVGSTCVPATSTTGAGTALIPQLALAIISVLCIIIMC